MIPFGDYRTHRRENKGLNKGKDEVRRCPKPRVTRGKRVWWEHRLSWMLIAPSVSVLEAPIDAIGCFFFFSFFPSHLETSCFLNWMNFKVMVAHLKSENWGFSHSLPLSWVVGVIHSNSEFTSWSKLDDLSSLYLGGKKRSLISQGLIFQEPIIQAFIIHFVKFLGLLLPPPPSASCWVLVIFATS